MIFLESLFNVFPNTMSVHLKEKLPPMVKHGSPGNWKLDALNNDILSNEKLSELAELILDYTQNEDECFIEDDIDYIQIVQLKNYRIVISRPPFSNVNEITIVRPTTQKILNDYHLPKKLIKRLKISAEGILIAGAPGHGKSTFASALAKFYADQNKIVKTIEKPRDLQVDDRITQFTIIPEDYEKVGDIILLIRPDYVIFDEIRKNIDFNLYADLRLAGVGMVGVIHATKAIDAIQRFVNRIELGLIPNIIDTIIFIENGYISNVLSLTMKVKTPYGFRDESLARPVIEVRDFNSNSNLYEIFSFGEQVVVIPLKNKPTILKHYSTKDIEQNIVNILKNDNITKFLLNEKTTNKFELLIPMDKINAISDNALMAINSIEQKYKIIIDLIPQSSENDIIDVFETNKYLIILTNDIWAGKRVNLMSNGEFILHANVDNQCRIKLSRKKASTKRIYQILDNNNELTITY